MINLISKDLRKEECYVQIADCLEQLEKITTESFDRVNNKLKSMNNDLVDIERRSEIVKYKIEQIKKNSNKAIQIFSPFYYPAKNIKDRYRYESLFNTSKSKRQQNQFENNQCTINQPPKYNIQQPFELFHPDDLNDHLNFLDLDTFLQSERESLNFLQRQKLNKSTIPWSRIKSISSLIIFNSSETAYIKSDQDSSVYDFKSVNKQKKNEEGDEINFGSMAPPKSMTKSQKEKFDTLEQNLFRLDTQDAPKVLDNLPNDLPDLGAVADDIFFKEDTFSFNVPSINFNENRDEQRQQTESKQLPLFRIFSFDQSSTSSIEEIKPSTVQISGNKKSEQQTTSRSTSEIPAPPPMPEIQNLSSFESSLGMEKPVVEKTKAPMVDSTRASLLDAIRKAGGRPDKSRVTIKEKKLKERKNRKEAVSTDLMSDLKKHLMSRRKAMTGASKVSGQQASSKKDTAGNVYSTMNKMIPSPTASSVQSSASDDDATDDDWMNQ